LLLGRRCEAGFFPGIIFYLTLWFPAVYRARVISFFMAGDPRFRPSSGRRSPGFCSTSPAFGLDGWQWLFILEAFAVGSGRTGRPVST